MEIRSSQAALKNEIQLLEVEQAFQERLLKEQLYLTYESLKPVNLLRSSLSQVVSSPYLIDSILGTAVGLTTGYLSKILVVGASGNLIRKLFGFITQLGVTNTVAHHPEAIRSIGQSIYQYLIRKKRVEL
jgi:hypothetical protein